MSKDTKQKIRICFLFVIVKRVCFCIRLLSIKSDYHGIRTAVYGRSWNGPVKKVLYDFYFLANNTKF